MPGGLAGASGDSAVSCEANPARDRRLAAIAGWKGFALASAIACWVVFALWLVSNGGPSAAGHEFRFTPPPAATAQPGVTPAVPAGG